MPQPQGARLPAPRLHSPHAAKAMQSLVMFSDRLLGGLAGRSGRATRRHPAERPPLPARLDPGLAIGSFVIQKPAASARPISSKANPSQTKPHQGIFLGFPWILSSDSGLFNGLQRFQRKILRTPRRGFSP